MKSTIQIMKKNIEINKSEIIAQLNTFEDDIVFLSGSLVEEMVNPLAKGMGNRLSDIDCYVMTDSLKDVEIKASDFEYNNIKRKIELIKKTTLDVKVYSKFVIQDYVEQINKLDFNINQRAANWLKVNNNSISIWEINSFIHRILNSIPIQNEIEYNQIKANISTDNFMRYNLLMSTNEVDTYFDDVIGNLEVCEHEVAMLVAHEMLIVAMRAYLFNSRESVDRNKWVPVKLKNLSKKNGEAEAIYNSFTRLLFASRGLSADEQKSNIEEIIKFVNNVLNLFEG